VYSGPCPFVVPPAKRHFRPINAFLIPALLLSGLAGADDPAILRHLFYQSANLQAGPIMGRPFLCCVPFRIDAPLAVFLWHGKFDF
jgi:hypothetical protein